MPRWLRVALLISIPCLVALMTYDWVAFYVLRRGHYRLVPAQDFARGVTADLGLVAVYAVTVTPRVLHALAEPLTRAAQLSLIMLGLGIAWYDVLCAFVTRLLPEPPDLWISLVVLFVIPVLVAPWYLRWVHSKA